MKPARRHKDPWKRQPDVTAVVEEAEAQETQKHRRQSSRPTTLQSRPDARDQKGLQRVSTNQRNDLVFDIGR